MPEQKEVMPYNELKKLFEQKKDVSYDEFKQLSKSEHHVCSGCLIMDTLELLGGKWRMLVIYQLAKRPTYRFGELKKTIPDITNTMLTTVLKDLENHKIVKRVQFNEIPPHVEYSLTDKGKALFPVFYEMAKWAAMNP
ncbi:MAG: helix-turn-helix domain-containing protein [Lachnospiraceae bacterium]|nr:helix-turn-helix domain-containing protein [Lachnospiraceae bacterium]